MSKRLFSHVPYASDYMKIALKIALDHVENNAILEANILDIPAGNGWIGEQCRKTRHTVISADINKEQPNFAQIDMETRLPFEDGQFNAVICCEGI